MLSLPIIVSFVFQVTGVECRTLSPGQMNPLRAQVVLTGVVENATNFSSLPEQLVSVQLGTDCEKLAVKFPLAAGRKLKFRGQMEESGAGHHSLTGEVRSGRKTLDVEAYWED